MVCFFVQGAYLYLESIMEQSYLDISKSYWQVANKFPLNKEEIYPEHGKAHNFDGHHGEVCLEYGCGGGSDTLSMLRRGNFVYFVDIVPENVQITHENTVKAGLSEKTQWWMLEDSAKILLPDNCLDVVNCHGVLHHIHEPESVLREFHRVLKPGGILYCMLYTEIMWRHFHATIKQLMLERNIDQFEAFCLCSDSGGPYARAYTEDEAYDLFENNGFVIENVIEYKKLNSFFRTFWCVKPTQNMVG